MAGFSESLGAVSEEYRSTVEFAKLQNFNHGGVMPGLITKLEELKEQLSFYSMLYYMGACDCETCTARREQFAYVENYE